MLAFICWIFCKFMTLNHLNQMRWAVIQNFSYIALKTKCVKQNWMSGFQDQQEKEQLSFLKASRDKDKTWTAKVKMAFRFFFPIYKRERRKSNRQLKTLVTCSYPWTCTPIMYKLIWQFHIENIDQSFCYWAQICGKIVPRLLIYRYLWKIVQNIYLYISTRFNSVGTH